MTGTPNGQTAEQDSLADLLLHEDWSGRMRQPNFFYKVPFYPSLSYNQAAGFSVVDWLCVFSKEETNFTLREEDVSVCGLLIRKIICGDIFLHNPRLFWKCLRFFISLTITEKPSI